MATIELEGTLEHPKSATGYGVTLSESELAAILAKIQAHDQALGYNPRPHLEVGIILQELYWKAEESGLALPDDTDPDPDPRM